MPTHGSLDDVKCAYTAGYVDGDGSINASIMKQGRHAGEIRTEISIASVNSEPLKVMQSWFNVGYFDERTYNNRSKKVHFWKANSHADMLIIINAIIPFLINRKKQAVLMQEYLTSRLNKPRVLVDIHKNNRLYRVPHRPKYSEDEIEMIMKLRDLNRKGI